MFSFQSIELYDPESPSIDDLCLELDQSSTCKVSGEFSVNFSSEIEDAENHKVSATQGSVYLALTQDNTTVHDEQECVADVTKTDERVKPAVVSKPAIIWKSTKKTLGPVLREFDDAEAVKDSTMKVSLNVNPPDINTPDLDNGRQSLNSEHQQCSNSDSFVNSAMCDDLDTINALKVSSVSEPVAVQKVHVCDKDNECTNGETDNQKFVHVTLETTHTSEPGSMLHDRHTNSIVDIADPTEPCDQMMTLSQQPRTVTLSHVEDPSEPDEFLQTSDPCCSNEHVKCPRIIRLDRDHDIERLSDISDPSEPTDIEPLDGENSEVIPREIKLNRDDDSKTVFDSFSLPNKLYSSSLIKPRAVHLNTLFGKTHFDYSNTSHVAETNPVVDLSEGKTANKIVYCRDTPLSPTESIESVSVSDHEERQASESPSPRVIMLDDCNNNDATDAENKCKLSYGTCSSKKADQSVSNHQYLSDGEIVDKDEEEMGIFQISGSASYSRKEKKDIEQHKKKNEKKRMYEGIVDDVGLQHHNKSDDGPDHSRSNKRQKVSKDVGTPELSISSYISKHVDKTVNMPAAVLHLLHDKCKVKSKLRKQKDKKRKVERASRSSEKLLVGDSRTTKRKVVVINKTVDESKKEKHSEHSSWPSNNGKLEFEKRKHSSKRHHKRRMHQDESHAHKRKKKHKKCKHRKNKYDAEGSCDEFEQRHNRSRSRSYDRIVEIIRSEEQQPSYVRHLRSVVVHKNTLISARHQSSSCDSCDSHHSFDNFATSDVCQNSDSRSRNLSDGHMHLSRLSYSGELEQDGHTTLLGECMKSKYGPDYDIISRNLANLCSSTDSANDEVEILGVSYPKETHWKNNSVQNAISTELRGNGSEYEHREVATSLDHQPHVPVVGLLSAAGKDAVTVKNLPTNGVGTGTNEIESKKVSKEVQTQISLFTEAHDGMTEHSILSESSNSKPCCDHGKADKELQVSDFDNDEECIRSPSSVAAVDGNTISSECVSFSEVVSGIQSPENRTEEGSHVPRPVLLETVDAPKPTPDSPQRDFSDLYVTVPNVSGSLLSVTKTIALDRVAENFDGILPQIAVPDTTIAQLESAVSSTENSNTSNAGLERGKSDVDATERLSFEKSDSDVVHANASKKEQCHVSNHNICAKAPAFHHLPPVVQHKPIQNQRAVPRHVVNPPFTENISHCSTVRLPGTSAIQQLKNEQVAAVSCCAQLRPLNSQSLSVGASRSALTVSGSVSSSVSPHLQRQNQNKRSPEMPESLSFFTVTSDRIPGICEDVEDVESRIRTSTSLSSHQSSLLTSSFFQSSGNLGVINVVVTTAATTEAPQQTVAPSYAVMRSSYMASDALHLLSSQASSASVTHSTPQGTVMPTVTTSSVDLVAKQHISPFLPLLGSLATQLFKKPEEQKTSTMPASRTIVASTTANSIVPAVSTRTSIVSVPALKYADAVSAWITSLPQSTKTEKPQPSSQPLLKPSIELDFDVDAVESPRSDEIMSFSPPSSEHMMAVVKMKHTVGLTKKSSKNTKNGLKKPNKETKVS